MSDKRMLLFPILLAALMIVPAARADLKLDSIHFDPAIIASGDRVDIVIQYHETGSALSEAQRNNPDYRFQVQLQPDATLSRQHILIEDADGKDLQGFITTGGAYNKRFRIKVADNAPAGEYDFIMRGQWFYDGQPQAGSEYFRFSIPVKKQGIVLSVANVVSSPERVRSGDKNILLTTTLTNTGEKGAKNVRIRLEYPEGITSSYTNNNDLNIGSLASMQQGPVQFYVDTDRSAKEGIYPIGYTLAYQDAENNNYEAKGAFPFVIKKKPDIVVTRSEGTGLAGGEIELRVTVQNRGEETADAVDVRILKQSSQPFEMDVRSDYVGQLVPGENATAVFTLDAHDEAEIKEHKLSVVIRARGDSEEGDDNVYTFTDAATVSVTGKMPNRYPLYAGVFLGLVLAIFLVTLVIKRKDEHRK